MYSHYVQLIQSAEAATNNSNLTEAISHYDLLLQKTGEPMISPEISRLRCKAWRERGRLFDVLSDREASLASFEQYYLEAKESQQVVDALILIGNQRHYMGQYQQAKAAFNEAKELAVAYNDVAGRAHAFCGLGIINNTLGHMDEAIRALHTALSLFKQTGNQIEQIRTGNRLGVAYIRTGQVDKAIDAFLTCRDLVTYETDQDPTALTAGVNALNNLGECYQLLYQMETALAYHRLGLTIAEDKELWSQAADLYRNMGVDLLFLGEILGGFKYLHRALELSEETKQPDLKLQTLYSLALAEINNGNLQNGIEYANTMQALAEESSADPYKADALYVKGLYYQKMKVKDVAERMWHEALFVAQQTNRRTLLWQIHAALARITAEGQLQDVHNRIAAEIILQIAEPIADESLRQKFLSADPIKEILPLVPDTSLAYIFRKQ